MMSRVNPPLALTNSAFLREHEIIPKPAQVLAVPIRDPADAWVLASAVAAGANVLVTGDQDLLVLGSRAPIRVLDPRGFWELTRGALHGKLAGGC